MRAFIPRPTIANLNELRNVLPAEWFKFGVEYKSVHKNSAGFVIGGQLHDGRRFTLNQTTKQFTFLR